MSRTFTVGELATKVRLRGDFENSDFITDALLIDVIDAANTELWDLLTQKWENYQVDEHTFATVAGTQDYDLPEDFYKLLGVDVQDGNRWYKLHRYDLHERNRYEHTHYYNTREGFRYALHGTNTVRFTPTPKTAYTIKLLYIPCAPKLTSLNDTVEGINGYEQLVVNLAVRECLDREESSTTRITRKIDEQIKRIMESSDARDAGAPMRVQDTSIVELEYWG